MLAGPIRTLTDLTADMSVAPKVMWGNVSSAVNGAVRAIRDAHPDLTTAAMDLARVLGTTSGPGFRRNSCCLIYLIAAPGPTRAPYCGDCVLAPAR